MQMTMTRNGCTATLESLGGELISYRDGEGIEYIWNGDPAYWPGRNPLLFPIVGSLAEDKPTTLWGEPCQMGRHGFARHGEFTLVDQGEDYAVLELTDSEETLRQYPGRFRLRVRQQLIDSGFQTGMEVLNTWDRPLVFCIGAHTGFNCPLRTGERFEDYQLVFDQPEDIPETVQDTQGNRYQVAEPGSSGQSRVIPLGHDVFDGVDTLQFHNPNSTGVSLLHRQTGRGVHMEFAGFPVMAFWTKPNANAPYLCIEPWHGCSATPEDTGDFRDKPYSITLAPGESFSAAYTVERV